jgi:PTS system mannose-specific IIA component
MIGLVLVTHGRLAAEFVAAMEHVVGAQDRVEPICIAADDDMELRRADIAAAVARCNAGQGVIILTDMFGGTPSNLAISLLGPQVEVIAGVNLPMLIRALTYRDQTLEQMLAKAISGGCDGVVRMPQQPEQGTGQADAAH